MGWGYPKQFGNKYKNTAVSLPGRPKRHSKLEAAVEAMLILMQKNGEIYELKAQPRVTFRGATKKKTYIPDFTAIVVATNERHYWEAKGMETLEWGWKLVAWELQGPGPLHIYKGTYKSPYLHETILPLNYKKQSGS